MNRVSQISKIFGPTVFCVLLNERKLVRPSLGSSGVVYPVGHASNQNHSLTSELWRPGQLGKRPSICPAVGNIISGKILLASFPYNR